MKRKENQRTMSCQESPWNDSQLCETGEIQNYAPTKTKLTGGKEVHNTGHQQEQCELFVSHVLMEIHHREQEAQSI